MDILINDNNCPNFIGGDICYSCGIVTCKNKKCPNKIRNKCKISKTNEHIPPRALFTQSSGFSGYILSDDKKRMVNSCLNCNNLIASDEDYFLSILTLHASNWNPIAEYAAYSRRLRGIIKNEKFRQKMKTGVERNLPLSTLGSIYLCEISHSFKIDVAKFDKINIKIIRGLYFKHFNQVLNNQPVLKWHNFPTKKNNKLYTDALNPEFKGIISTFEFNKNNKEIQDVFFYEDIQPNVFSYGYLKDTMGRMVWLLNYYNGCLFFFEVKH